MTIIKGSSTEDRIPALMHIILQMISEHPFLCEVTLDPGVKQCL